ncbi:MAG: sigma 54-interacting transcriptional regulator [Syntrophobacteraceae bacterium]
MNRKFQEFRGKGSLVKPHDSGSGNKDEDESRDGVERAVTLPGENRFIVSDRAMSAAVHAAMQVAPLPATVLIRGESGTGKESFAHRVGGFNHCQSVIQRLGSTLPGAILGFDTQFRNRGIPRLMEWG